MLEGCLKKMWLQLLELLVDINLTLLPTQSSVETFHTVGSAPSGSS